MQSLTLQQVKEKLKTLDDKTLSNMLKQRQDNFIPGENKNFYYLDEVKEQQQ